MEMSYSFFFISNLLFNKISFSMNNNVASVVIKIAQRRDLISTFLSGS